MEFGGEESERGCVRCKCDIDGCSLYIFRETARVCIYMYVEIERETWKVFESDI